MSLKSLLKNVLGSAADTVASEVKKQLSEKVSTVLDASPVSAPAPSPAPAAVKSSQRYTPEELKNKIESALKQIDGISFVRDMPACELSASAHPAAKPVSFMVEKDGAKALAIMVVANNTYRSMPVVGTQRLLDDAGVKFIRFFTELGNEDGYIINRIKENL